MHIPGQDLAHMQAVSRPGGQLWAVGVRSQNAASCEDLLECGSHLT